VRLVLDVSAVPERPVGAGVYTVNLAHGLAARPELELHLLARHGDRDRWADLGPSARVHTDAPARRPARLAWEQLGAPRFARRVAPDVWHGPHYTMPLRLAPPAVVSVHDLTFFDHPEWHERDKVLFFRRMIRASARRARVLVAVSQYTAARLRAVLNPSVPITVVPHGVDHDRFRPVPTGTAGDVACLRAFGVRPPYIAFAGTLEPRKDVPTLVRAFAIVASDRPDLRLVLAGTDGWGAPAVRAAIERSGVASRILRPGYLPTDAVAALFRGAAAVAYPSLVEGFGLPALEALACGAPLVTTTGSAMEEVVGDAALLVPPGDSARVANALEQLLTDRGLADRLRGAGPRRAAGFTWEASVSGHLETYQLAAGVPA
jgi:glycosyltransferase involved in cell wall biosynthesis